MKIKEIMTPAALCLSADDSMQEAAQCMRDLHLGALPVCEQGRLVGLVSEHDIVVRGVAAGEAAENPVRDVMSVDVIKAFADQDVVEISALMEAQQIRHLPVVDRDEQLVGSVDMGDIARQSGSLPEDRARLPDAEPRFARLGSAGSATSLQV